MIYVVSAIAVFFAWAWWVAAKDRDAWCNRCWGAIHNLNMLRSETPARDAKGRFVSRKGEK